MSSCKKLGRGMHLTFKTTGLYVNINKDNHQDANATSMNEF